MKSRFKKGGKVSKQKVKGFFFPHILLIYRLYSTQPDCPLKVQLVYASVQCRQECVKVAKNVRFSGRHAYLETCPYESL